jgi:hypothetical protein
MAETESAGKKIWIPVAAGLILSLILYVTPWLRENVLIPCGKGLWRLGAAIGHHLASSATIPWWLLWILILLSSIVLLQLAGLFLNRKAKTTTQNSAGPTDWHDFTAFVYQGVNWVWRYDFGKISNLTARCPVCSCLLDPKGDVRNDASVMTGMRPVTAYWCDHCQVERLREDGRPETIVDRVQKEIDRLLVSGEWKNHVRQRITAGSEQEAES